MRRALIIAALAAAPRGGHAARIRVSLFLPLTYEDGTVPKNATTRSIGIAAVMAADQFNARNGSLVKEFETRCDGVDLAVETVWNTFRSKTKALNNFVYGYVPTWDNVDDSENRVVAGPSYSSVSSALAPMVQIHGMPLISYGSTSPSLDSPGIYPNFMRTVPSDIGLAEAFCARCASNGWKSVAVLAQDDAFGQGLADAINSDCGRRGIFSQARYFEKSNVKPVEMERTMRIGLEDLAAQGKRVYFLVVTTGRAMETAGRLAIELGQFGDNFAWHTQINWGSSWLSVDPAVQKEFFPGFARIDVSGVAPDKEVQFLTSYLAQDAQRFAYFGNTAGAVAVPTQSYIDQGITSTTYAGFMFDAVATIGLGACARDADPSLALLEAMQRTTFEGVSGNVRFDLISGSRLASTATYTLQNIQLTDDGEWVHPQVGSWDGQTGWVDTAPFIFYDGSSDPPSDGIVAWCPPGAYLEDNACRPCPAGTSQSNVKNIAGLDSCISCNATAWSREAAVECTACPGNSHIYPKAEAHDSPTLCICDSGHYATQLPISHCHECPNHATCDGGLTGPYPDEEYWLDPLNPPTDKLTSYKCRYSWICQGGSAPATCHETDWPGLNASCVDADGESVTLKNYDHWCSNGWDAESPMCSGEIQGRYWYIDTQAVRCPRNGKVAFSVGIMVIVLLLFFAINEVRPKYPVFDVVLTSYQDLGIITLYFFDWSEKLSNFFFVFRVALFDVDVVEPTCAFEWGFNQAFRYMLALPFCMAIVQACGHLLKLRSGDEAYAGTLSFFLDAQGALLYYCISTFICRRIRPSGHLVYVEDADTFCDTKSTLVMQIIAALYLLLILVVTLAIFRRLWTAAADDELRSERVLVRYGFLYRRFRMGAAFWTPVRMVKQAGLVVILAWWNSPEDQAMFASIVLCFFAVAAAWVRPETEGAVNLTELAGVGISIFVVALGLSFTAHHRQSNADGKDMRYVAYFSTVQILFLLGAMRATFINVRAVRARMAVEKRVAALHDGVVRARRRGTLLSQESRILREAMSSDTTTSPRTPLERLRRAFSSDDATASPRTPRGFASIDSPASSASGRMRANIRKLARKMSTLRGSTSLTATQAAQLEGHGREIEEMAEGRLEVLHTFKGPPLRAYMRARDSTDVRALLAFVNLERRMGPTVADDSNVGNFSRQHEARFYHELAQALPGLLDYVLCADADRRRALSAVISDVAAFDGHRHDAGARPLARLLIEPIDRPSVLYFSIHATQDELVCLRVVVDGMVSASPRILAQVEAVRARTRLAVRVQRAWRTRRNVVEAA